MDTPAQSSSVVFRRVYDTLKHELLRDPAFASFNNDDAIQWLGRMMDYNVLGGKQNRSLVIIESYKLLKAGSELSEEELFLACVLGWVIEWLLASYLLLDDIMDKSRIRRGKPCWYRLQKVGPIAITDGFILLTQISRILRLYFSGKSYYVDLLDLFNEVELQTTFGQLLDQITTNEAHNKYQNNYTVHVYHNIAKYKAAYYSFYLPVACALLLSGQSLHDYVQMKQILIEMGVYYQAQDDYLDCFGDPAVVGKIGNDIEEFKCSWLFVQALQCADDKQKDFLFENCGKSDPACVEQVKALYKELKLEMVFSEYERESYEKIIFYIGAQPSETVQAVLKYFLHKIYKRRK